MLYVGSAFRRTVRRPMTIEDWLKAAIADAEHRVVARERAGAAAQVLRRERAGRRRLGAAHSCDRTAQRSGNIGRKSVVRRYAAPEDPPVPILSPIVRSTIFTWR